MATLVLYWPVWENRFINTDDEVYITDNSHVTSGLTLANVRWSLTSTEAANWHPLTWMSHMMDCQLFGLEPGAHHMASVLFHIANCLLLLLLLKDATGAFWRSVIVAAFFAWHPMHVESVAWAAERKDVLSTFFWLLSLLAYVRYSRSQKLTPYILSLLFFIGGLMSKPMVVTLPFVLLLLDWWPLNRVAPKSLARLFVEKIPFFALMMAGCIITYFAQEKAGAITSPAWLEKIGAAAVAYINYAAKLLYPVDLACPYSQNKQDPVLWMTVSAVLLVIWSGVAALKAKEKPYFIVGWFFFLGTLVPAIGIIKVGAQTMADRYAYIPSIGLFIVIVWGLYDLLKSQPNRHFVGGAAATACLGLSWMLSSAQIEYWRNGQTLFQHSLAVTKDNFLAENWLGNALLEAGETEPARNLFEQSVAIEPHYGPGQADLAKQLLAAGKTKESLDHLWLAAALDPADAAIQQNLGAVLATEGKAGEGIVHFETALKLEPHSARTMNQLAWIYATDSDARNRDGKRAVQLAQEACAATLNENPLYLRTLGAAYGEMGDFSQAAHWLERARIVATVQQQTNSLNELPDIERAISAQLPYRDPLLR